MHFSSDRRDQPASPSPQEPGTTHASWGAGSPRLHVFSDDRRFEQPLPDRLAIGSAESSDLQLPDIEPQHAVIVHDDRDEYVVTLLGPGQRGVDPSAPATHPDPQSETLRTGARFTAGPWTFVFEREEFADHGRPFGGRDGGELSDQPQQQSRPDYGDETDAAAEGPSDIRPEESPDNGPAPDADSAPGSSSATD